MLSALFDWISIQVPEFTVKGRRVKFWDEVKNQNCFFLRHTAAEDEFANNIMQRTTVEAEVWIYSPAGEDPETAPDIGLNCLVKKIRDCFAPDDRASGRFTIGGNAFWCRISGRTEYDPGDIDGIAKAVIPVKITLP